MTDTLVTPRFSATEPRWPRPALLAVAALTVALVAALATLAWVLATAPDVPAEDSAAVGFARDMSTHHAQAVEMSAMILDRSDDPLIRHIATEILYQQQAEFGQMQGWLDVWGYTQNSGAPAMAWMGHPVEGRMPGMASAEELQALAAAHGAEAEQLFLRLMIVHHQAGADMIEAVLERTDRPEVIALAERMLRVQNTEIADMQALLDEGASVAPAPSEHAGHAG